MTSTHAPGTRPIGHGALAAFPRAGTLVAARRVFDGADATDRARLDAARVMLSCGATHDMARAARYLAEYDRRQP